MQCNALYAAINNPLNRKQPYSRLKNTMRENHGSIPIFPLSTTIFYPNTYLPLHIFEPRYKQMVTDTLKEKGLIGIVIFKPGWEESYFQNPEIVEPGSSQAPSRRKPCHAPADDKDPHLLEGSRIGNFEISKPMPKIHGGADDRAREGGGLALACERRGAGGEESAASHGVNREAMKRSWSQRTQKFTEDTEKKEF